MEWGSQLDPRTAGNLVYEIGCVVFLWLEIETLDGGVGRWVETLFSSLS